MSEDGVGFTRDSRRHVLDAAGPAAFIDVAPRLFLCSRRMLCDTKAMVIQSRPWSRASAWIRRLDEHGPIIDICGAEERSV
jgi:hypothetical protein